MSNSTSDSDEPLSRPAKSVPSVPAPSGETQDSSAEVENVSLFQLLSVVLRHRYPLLACTVGVAFLVVTLTLITYDSTFTSGASFIPQGGQRGGGGGLQAVAGQFGLSIPLDGGSESPAFYADLLRSREIHRHVLADTFTAKEMEGRDTIQRTGTILEFLELEEESEALRRERGLRWLEDAISTTADRETGVVQLSVKTPWPRVSRDIAQRLLDLANEFNLRTRQSQASAERAFIEERLVEAREELRQAEEELKRFLETNRQFRNSPELLFEHDRLERQVTMRHQVFTALNQSYQDARISEVRDTPVITVVKHPEVPVERDPRGLAVRAILGLILGGLLGLFVAFGREMVHRTRRKADSHYEQFRHIWADSLNDVRSIFSRLFG